MAGRTHVNPQTGKYGTCRANKGSCPFGEENHFDSPAEAVAHYEKTMESYTVAASVSKAKVQDSKLAPAETDTTEDLQRKLATAQDRAASPFRSKQAALDATAALEDELRVRGNRSETVEAWSRSQAPAPAAAQASAFNAMPKWQDRDKAWASSASPEEFSIQTTGRNYISGYGKGADGVVKRYEMPRMKSPLRQKSSVEFVIAKRQSEGLVLHDTLEAATASN